MLGIVSEDENHNKVFKPMAGATLGQGVPLGAWCSFEKDVAPSNNWLIAGTTFDASVYPALNLYLGTNVVPSRYDHNRLGDWETITLPTTSVNAMTMEYDGELYVMVTNDNNTITQIYVNTLRYDIGATAGGIGGSVPIIIPVKKGDTVYQGGSVTEITARLAYYTHPLFIKATSIASDSDQQSILAQIQAYNTYSTEETLTGKTWLDGKPIYRKCGNATGSISFNPGDNAKTIPISWFNTSVKTDVDKILKLETGSGANGNCGLSCYWRDTIIDSTGINVYYNGSRGYGITANTVLVIEYTKTND